MAVVHVDKDHWISLHKLVPGLAHAMPQLPIRTEDRHHSTPLKRGASPPPAKTSKRPIPNELEPTVVWMKTRVWANYEAVGLLGPTLQLMLGVFELDAKLLGMHDAPQRQRAQGAKGSGGPLNLQGERTSSSGAWGRRGPRSPVGTASTTTDGSCSPASAT